MKNDIIQALEREFSLHDNADKAVQFSAYMKNKFSFFGVYQPKRKEIQKPFVDSWKKLSIEQKWELVFELWDKEEREFQYVALDMLKSLSKKEMELKHIEYTEILLKSKSWWDSVDLLASSLVGALFQKYPEERSYWLDKWTHSDHLWLMRTTLIFQLKYKNETDFEVLKKQIQFLKNNSDFFIQKAIGWSLREYAKTKPEVVREFVAQNELSYLATTQALKNLDKKRE